MSTIPIVDVAPLLPASARESDVASVARQIDHACRRFGFFYVVGHGVSDALQRDLVRSSRRFFGQSAETKARIRMELGGKAWRGYFPVGAELTSGEPDGKEGIYFGAELDASDPRVAAGTPLFGANLFPDIEGFREAVLRYMDSLTRLGQLLVGALAVGLGLERDYFAARYCADPLVLFRIFNYPPLERPNGWSVGEHTDYGMLTILWQDDSGGLEVKSPAGWIDAPPIPGSFVCNIGDMLDRTTSGRYPSTPHRVRNRSANDRLSLAFFFDPSFEAEVRPIDPDAEVIDDTGSRWDGTSPHLFGGTYGEYLLRKVGKVFPDLGRSVLD